MRSKETSELARFCRGARAPADLRAETDKEGEDAEREDAERDDAERDDAGRDDAVFDERV